MTTQEAPQFHEHEHLDPGETPSGQYEPSEMARRATAARARLMELQLSLHREEAGDQKDLNPSEDPSPDLPEAEAS